MNLTDSDIDWIVAEVVRRLESLSGRRQPEATSISDKIITLETLKRFPNETELRISPKAIITPAARDELKKRNLQLIRQGEQNIAQRAATTTITTKPGNILAANLGVDYEPKVLAQLVSAYGATCEHHPASALAAVIDAQATRVGRDSLKAIWFSRHPAHAVCLANRRENMWAVQGIDEQSVLAATSAVAANVLVIDPKGKSQYTLRRMLDIFLK